MKLAISNIAWDQAEEADVAKLLSRFNVKAVEVAPTKIWPQLESISRPAAEEYVRSWQAQGVEIVAMQSLLFGHPELTFFENDDMCRKTVEYLRGIIEIGALLGVKVLVFGSPKNRSAGWESTSAKWNTAVRVFRELGEIASAHGIFFCIEPNPEYYSCTFVRNTKEGVALVDAVDHRGFRLHLDAAAMTLNGEDYQQAIAEGVRVMEHFHVSEPDLAVVGKHKTDHGRIKAALTESGYGGYVSIEMRNGWTSPNTVAVEEALSVVTEIYR